jgi:putative Mg2+ transporter-C (MgtC) family protein
MFDPILAELATGWPDAGQLMRAALRLFTAALCGAAVGLQRERLGKPAGLRTHILVASGTALFIVAASEAGMALPDLSRVIQGLVTGIGFLGAGSILKLEMQRQIKGLTTAADIWITAAAGVAAGLGRLGLALMATALALVVLVVLRRVDDWVKQAHARPDEPGA